MDRRKPAYRRPLLLGLIAVLTFTTVGCDSTVSDRSGPPPGEPILSDRTSPLDGSPIVRLSAEAFYRGAYTERVLEQIRARAPEVRERLQGASKRGGPVPLHELLASAGAAKSDWQLPTHLEIVEEGEAYQLLLTVETARRAGAGKSGETPAFLIPSPDDLLDLPEDGEPFEVRGVRLDDGGSDYVLTLTYEGEMLDARPAEGTAPAGKNAFADPEIYTISGTSVTEKEETNPPVPGCELNDDCDSLFDDDDDGSGTAGKRYPDELVYLALHSVRLNDLQESWGSAEVVMQVQPTDDFSKPYTKFWNYRFDKRATYDVDLLKLAEAGWAYRTSEEEDEYRRTYDLLTSTVESVSRETNTLNQGADLAAYHLPDINHEATTYYFTNLRAHGIDGKEESRVDHFPILELSAQSWRGLMVEKDQNPYERLQRRDGDWRGNVWTHHIGTGGVSQVYTRVDADDVTFGRNDKVIQYGAFRRANRSTVMSRTQDGISRFVSQSAGGRLAFAVVENRLN